MDGGAETLGMKTLLMSKVKSLVVKEEYTAPVGLLFAIDYGTTYQTRLYKTMTTHSCVVVQGLLS